MPAEVIVVDNNSKDKTKEVAERYPFVRVISEKRQGIAYARSAGFDAATSDIIGRIDADSILPPEWAETVGEFFSQDTKTAAVTGDCYFYDFPAKRFVKTVHHAFYYGMQRLVSGTEVLWGSNMAIKREAWTAVRQECRMERGLHEDIDLTFHLQDHGFLIKRYPKLVAKVSLRRGDLGPGSIVKYLWPWPRTYWANRRYFRGTCIVLILLAILVVMVPVSSIFWAFWRVRELFL